MRPITSIVTIMVCYLISSESLGDCPSSITGPEKIGELGSKEIAEASGLAASWRNRGVFWTHNDGSKEKVYALDSTGSLIATFRITKSVSDVEAIAVGPGPLDGISYIYVGDIGSNDASRDEVRIFRVPEPEVKIGSDGGTLDFDGGESITLKYPSGNYDAEALLVDPVRRELYIVTKEDGGAHIFGVPLANLVKGEKSELQEVGQVGFSRVSDGAISKDGTLIALRREDQGYFWGRTMDQTVMEALRAAATPLKLAGLELEPNGEGITFLLDATGYLTVSEGENQPIFQFRFSQSEQIPVLMANPRPNNGTVELQAMACAGTRVAIQRSGDLVNWQTVDSFVAGDGVYGFTDAANRSQSFYRLVAQ